MDGRLYSYRFEDFIERARCDVAEWSAFSGDNYFSIANLRWQEWAGNALTRMMYSREETLVGLHHADPGCRIVATCLVREYWPSDLQLFIAPILAIAFEDPNSVVRGSALCSVNDLQCLIDDPDHRLRSFCHEVFEPMPAADISELFAECQSMGKLLRHEMAEARQRFLYDASNLAKEYFAEMCSDIVSTRQFLHHREPRVRHAALMVLSYYWKVGTEYAPICERIMLDEADTKVRIAALQAWLSCYRATTDTESIGFKMANIVLKNTEVSEVRRVAYHGLFMLRGLPVGSWPDIFDPAFEIERDVDWAFVRSFQKKSKKSDTHLF
jgi:hypothetical protein